MTPKIRQTLYAVGTIATSLLGLISVWGVLDPAKAGAINAALAGLLSLLGVGAAGTAAVITKKQRDQGLFEEHNPADVVVSGIDAVLKARQQAEEQVDRVRVAVESAVRDTPVIGPLASQILDQLK